MRIAIARNAQDQRHLQALLPDNYSVLGVLKDNEIFVIGGEDKAGWNLEDYVIPRAASGMVYIEEVTEDGIIDGNQAIFHFGGSAVLVVAQARDRILVQTFDKAAPKVNGIPVTFRVHIEVTPSGGIRIFDNFIYRDDDRWGKEVSGSGKAKISEFAIGLVQDGKVSKAMLASGEIRKVEWAIEAEAREIERLTKDLLEARDRKVALERQRDGLLVS